MSLYLDDTNLHLVESKLKEALEQFGIDVGSVDNDNAIKQLVQSYGVTVKPDVAFLELENEQWEIWFELARDVQRKNGENTHSTSSQETDAMAGGYFSQFNGNIIDATASLLNKPINIETGVSEEEQESSFQNATLQGSNGIAISIATYIPESYTKNTENEIKDKLEQDLQPLIPKGYKFEVKIGKDSNI